MTRCCVAIGLTGEVLPAHQHNHENHALYAVWPFRQYGLGKPNLPLAQATYEHRPHPCDHNWCQDVTDAAMLNKSVDAAKNVIARANAQPMASASKDHPGRGGRPLLARFRGYSAHYEDYEPAVDHLSMMRVAMHEMLVGRLDDAERQQVLLFPAWPVEEWDVEFKLRAPLNTTTEASCKGGVLEKLLVTPVSREADVKVLNCRRKLS